jgi:hypothetical protein
MGAGAGGAARGLRMGRETPWSSISPLRFLRDVASNGPATLAVKPRGDVATGYWWTLTFVADDGRERAVVAQDVAGLLRRAAEAEMRAREAWEAGPGGET